MISFSNGGYVFHHKHLCLIMVGTQSAWAGTGYKLEREAVAVGNLTFDLYKYYDDSGAGTWQFNSYAVLKGISGIAEEVVIPDIIKDGSVNYLVNYADGTISNSYVKKITFKRYINYYADLFNYYSNPKYLQFSGTLNCPSLETVEFKKGFSIDAQEQSTAPLQCSNLTTLILGGSEEPSLSGRWSDYSTADPSNITAYVAAWSQATCDDMHTNATVWSQFKAVLHGSSSSTVNLTITIDCKNYPPGAPVDLNSIFYNYNGEKVYGGQSRTFEVERGSKVDIIAAYSDNTYSVFWNSKTYLNGVYREHNGPFRASDNLQEDLLIYVECEPDCYFVPVANLSAAGTPHSLYWKDTYNHVHEIAPQSLFLVPVKKNISSGQTIYAMEDDHDNYTLRGYWYNGIDYMSNNDQSHGGVHYQDELWQGDEHRLEFTLQPTADLQERQVLIGLVDGAPTSDKLTIKATQGEGGAMGLQYTLAGVEQVKWYPNPISGGNLLANLDKSQLGNSFTLKVVPEIGRELLGIYLNDWFRSASNANSTSGDTLTYNLGNLKAQYDVYRISVVYKDVVDFSKRKIHVRSSGTPAGFARLVLRNMSTNNVAAQYVSGSIPTDFSVELPMGTEYKIMFMGQQSSAFNLKRMSVNGQLVTNTNATYTIGNFDEEIVLEFQDNTNVSAYASNGTVAMKKITSEGEEVPLGGGLVYSSNSINPSDGVKIFFTPNNGAGALKTLLVNSSEIDLENDSRVVLESDGSYSFTLSATQVQNYGGDTHQIQAFAEFEGGLAGTSYDLNNDGQVNITDVIVLVNRILGNN